MHRVQLHRDCSEVELTFHLGRDRMGTRVYFAYHRETLRIGGRSSLPWIPVAGGTRETAARDRHSRNRVAILVVHLPAGTAEGFGPLGAKKV